MFLFPPCSAASTGRLNERVSIQCNGYANFVKNNMQGLPAIAGGLRDLAFLDHSSGAELGSIPSSRTPTLDQSCCNQFPSSGANYAPFVGGKSSSVRIQLDNYQFWFCIRVPIRRRPREAVRKNVESIGHVFNALPKIKNPHWPSKRLRAKVFVLCHRFEHLLPT
jgi:hypothetical protein